MPGQGLPAAAAAVKPAATPAASTVGNNIPGTLPSAAGVGTIAGGYNNAISTLKDALGNTNNMFAGQQAAAATQLKQNQGAVTQKGINQGLDNTTVAQTMQQAPLATYNQSMLNIADSQASAQNSVLGQLASTYGQGGNSIGNYSNPQSAQNAAAANQAAAMTNANGQQANANSGVNLNATNLSNFSNQGSGGLGAGIVSSGMAQPTTTNTASGGYNVTIPGAPNYGGATSQNGSNLDLSAYLQQLQGVPTTTTPGVDASGGDSGSTGDFE